MFASTRYRTASVSELPAWSITDRSQPGVSVRGGCLPLPGRLLTRAVLYLTRPDATGYDTIDRPPVKHHPASYDAV